MSVVDIDFSSTSSVEEEECECHGEPCGNIGSSKLTISRSFEELSEL
jgi:hypothetical protein